MKKHYFGLLFGTVSLLIGCGGSGSSNPSTTPVQFGISWGARTRTINGPSSALSAVVTLAGAGTGGSDLNAEVDRASTLPAYTKTYTSGQAVKVGNYSMTIKFYAQASGSGDVVATGSADVTIAPNGTGIGTVSVINTIASVSIPAGLSVLTPQTANLTFTAKDSSGNLVAVTPGSASWSLVDGGSYVSLTPDGIATGLQRGIAHVKATVDGVTSSSVAVEASADPNGAAIVLNFDELAATPNQLSGSPVPVADQLSNQYLSSDGIVFSSVVPYVAVCTMPSGTAPSPPNSISGVSSDGFIAYGSSVPVNFTFYDPLNPTAPGLTKSFSVACDKDGVGSNTVELDAYDNNGVLVGKTAAADVGGEVLTLSFTKPTISKVVFLGPPTPFDGVSLDNVTFGPVVPISP